MNISSENRKYQARILESLKYASYIQRALFPSEKALEEIFPESFVFFRPRDIVSGDFYYVAVRNETAVIAVADCTGHGVPGALMSILGITFLNEIINRQNIFSAASVLNNLRERIMKALCQTGDEKEQKDGIDMSLCLVNRATGRLDFAGAFSRIYILREKELFEIHGDNMPVGIAPDEEKPFTSHHFDLKRNDCLYMFTDGYVDQFGGPSGKKLKYNNLKDLILNNDSGSMNLQREYFASVFDKWKGNLSQLDDVLLIGCKFST